MGTFIWGLKYETAPIIQSSVTIFLSTLSNDKNIHFKWESIFGY